MIDKKNWLKEVESELVDNILDFWLKHSPDKQNGGFYGEISNDLKINKKADKSLILVARLLWTFSLAQRVLQKDRYQDMSDRAYHYLFNNFLDEDNRGFFWTVNYQGKPVARSKIIYGHAFVIYALSEYYRVTESEISLQQAVDTFELIEKNSYDRERQGYFSSFTENWQRDDNNWPGVKDMNTHLHLIEAYTNLYRVWPDKNLQAKLKELLLICCKYIINENNQFFLYFDQDWQPQNENISYGHDIEGSWLLCEAAEVLNDTDLEKKIQQVAAGMAEATCQHGLSDEDGVYYEGTEEKIIDSDIHWWPQAEAVVGFLNCYQITGEKKYLNIAWRCWSFIKKYLVDDKYGEWYRRVDQDGKPYLNDFKVGSWKSAYHNSRACFEILARLKEQG